MQTAVDNSMSWSETNHQHLKANNTQYMLFTLQLKAHLEDLVTVNQQEITQTSMSKLLE